MSEDLLSVLENSDADFNKFRKLRSDRVKTKFEAEGITVIDDGPAWKHMLTRIIERDVDDLLTGEGMSVREVLDTLDTELLSELKHQEADVVRDLTTHMNKEEDVFRVHLSCLYRTETQKRNT